MEELRLEFPNLKHKEMIKKYQELTYEYGETYINGDGGCSRCDSYEQWLDEAKDKNLGINLKEGTVPGTTFFLITDDEIIGCINIRHRLNEGLLNSGGHIGYSIIPTKRRQGYATKLLKMGLEICKDLGIEKVLVTCDINNIGSAKTIEKCGGIFENTYYSKTEDKTYKRYWIGE